ncbi:MAG TPA: tetratricopeptide repeat protein [Syntrophorhabdales bacterium]|nr:tetratricopeptide repeat protein [Syntrophorhabdales bacterium]
MPRLQKTIAVFLVLFLIAITMLCLIDFGGGSSSINKLASLVGLKEVAAAPTIEAGRYGLSIVSKESVRPNVAALLVYAILGFIIASTIYSLQPKIGGLGSSDWVDVGRRMKESAYYQEAIDAYSIATQLNPGASTAFAERGVAYHKLGDYERAVQDYHTALRLRPVLTMYYRELGDYFNSLKLVAGHGLSDARVVQPEQAPSTDFLWCPNCFLAMKVPKGSRGCFNCPKCGHEFFA